jgi:hypothetical protein
MKPHKHRESTTCCCWLQALEPNENCPVHGWGPWPPRCEECGQFLPWSFRPAEDAIDRQSLEVPA